MHYAVKARCKPGMASELLQKFGDGTSDRPAKTSIFEIPALGNDISSVPST